MTDRRSRPAALVFDFDGLILDTEVPEYTTVRAVFEAHGLTLPLERWVETVGRIDQPHWLDRLEGELGAPLTDREAVRLQRMRQHHLLIEQEVVRPGVEALLDEADAEGIPVGVASSSPLSWVGGHLERLGVRHRFRALATGDAVARAKPWPDVYLAACESLAVAPTDAVALEDSANGSAAAHAAGLFCVVVPNDITRGQEFPHADLLVASLAQITLARLRDVW